MWTEGTALKYQCRWHNTLHKVAAIRTNYTLQTPLYSAHTAL